MVENNSKIPEIQTIIKGGPTKLIKINNQTYEIFPFNLEQKIELTDLVSVFIPIVREVIGEFRFIQLGFDNSLNRSNLKDTDWVCIIGALCRREIVYRLLNLIAVSFKKDFAWLAEQNFDKEHFITIGKLIAELNKLGDILPFFEEANIILKKEKKSKKTKIP